MPDRMCSPRAVRSRGRPRRCSWRAPSVADPRIEEGVADVDQEVDDDVAEAEKEDEPLDDRVVARQHRIQHQPPEAGNVVDTFRHHHASDQQGDRSEEHTSEIQSLMRSSYAVLCLKKKTSSNNKQN